MLQISFIIGKVELKYEGKWDYCMLHSLSLLAGPIPVGELQSAHKDCIFYPITLKLGLMTCFH